MSEVSHRTIRSTKVMLTWRLLQQTSWHLSQAIVEEVSLQEKVTVTGIKDAIDVEEEKAIACEHLSV